MGFLHSPFNPAAVSGVSGAVTESQALPRQVVLGCWWEDLMLQKGFSGENLFLRRNKLGMRCPPQSFHALRQKR